MNGVLLVNKPIDFTSRDVVNKLTKIFNTKKIGHTGTLDPIATGVLVICIGKSTKLCDILTSKYKEYIATIKLGIKTDTLDTMGTILEEQEVKTFTKEEITKVLDSFLGKSIQKTPIYSAVKVNGKKLYEYAREGIPVELPKREIDIQSIELLDYKDNEITFKTTVSKGTYIRALINDICTKLNTIGTMSSLIRTKQGEFSIDNCYTLEDIEADNYKLLSNEEVLSNIETIDIDDELLKPVNNGAVINKIFKGEIACLRHDKKIIAIYKTYEKDSNKAKPYIMF
ncbi:MAG: tRNA pseudouridine(55) synthase TruB [Bacilli bacterium]|nr:tRNA pseudouridine(55) synthase TruB [Bacilli bacterium]